MSRQLKMKVHNIKNYTTIDSKASSESQEKESEREDLKIRDLVKISQTKELSINLQKRQ